MPDGGDGSVDLGRDGPDGGSTDPNAIVVDTPSGVLATDSQDGFCDIIEAVAAAARGKPGGEGANPNGGSGARPGPGYANPAGKTRGPGRGPDPALPAGRTEPAPI